MTQTDDKPNMLDAFRYVKIEHQKKEMEDALKLVTCAQLFFSKKTGEEAFNTEIPGRDMAKVTELSPRGELLKLDEEFQKLPKHSLTIEWNSRHNGKWKRQQDAIDSVKLVEDNVKKEGLDWGLFVGSNTFIDNPDSELSTSTNSIKKQQNISQYFFNEIDSYFSYAEHIKKVARFQVQLRKE